MSASMIPSSYRSPSNSLAVIPHVVDAEGMCLVYKAPEIRHRTLPTADAPYADRHVGVSGVSHDASALPTSTLRSFTNTHQHQL